MIQNRDTRALYQVPPSEGNLLLNERRHPLRNYNTITRVNHIHKHLYFLHFILIGVTNRCQTSVPGVPHFVFWFSYSPVPSGIM